MISTSWAWLVKTGRQQPRLGFPKVRLSVCYLHPLNLTELGCTGQPSICVSVFEDFFFSELQQAGSAGELTLQEAALKQGFLETGESISQLPHHRVGSLWDMCFISYLPFFPTGLSLSWPLWSLAQYALASFPLPHCWSLNLPNTLIEPEFLSQGLLLGVPTVRYMMSRKEHKI